MLRANFLGLLLTVFFLGGCNDDEEIGHIFVYANLLEIPAGLNTLDTHIFVKNQIPNTLDLQLPPEVLEEDIISINPRSFRLTVVNSNENLSMLRKVVVRIEADGLPEKEIAYREEIPLNTGSFLDLIPSIGEIEPYLKADNFDLQVRLNFLQIPSSSFEMRMDYSFQGYTEE